MTQKLDALPHLSPLLSSPNPNLQKTAISLLSNMSRSASSSVQSTMGKVTFAYWFLFFKAYVTNNNWFHVFFNVSSPTTFSKAGTA